MTDNKKTNDKTTDKATNNNHQKIYDFINKLENLIDKTNCFIEKLKPSDYNEDEEGGRNVAKGLQAPSHMTDDLQNRPDEEVEFIGEVIDREDRESFERYYESMQSEFSQNMSFERIHSKVYLADLSKNSGISIEKLETYELGEECFDFEHMCRIAYSLNMTLGVIFGGS